MTLALVSFIQQPLKEQNRRYLRVIMSPIIENMEIMEYFLWKNDHL